MDVDRTTRDERRALAAAPSTPPEVLTELAADVALLPALLANPTTPEATRQSILVDFPHLRAKAPTNHPEQRAPGRGGDADAVLDRLRSRQQAADQAYRGRARFDHHRQLREVRVGATNGLAVASFVVSLFGMSLLAVVFGHVALYQIPRRGERGDGLAVAGLVIGYLGVVVGAWALLTRF